MSAGCPTCRKLLALSKVNIVEIDEELSGKPFIHWDDRTFEGDTLAEAAEKAWKYWRNCRGIGVKRSTR